VDIDPTIIQIGRAIHPEKPYASPQVNLIVDDARSYFKKTQGQYDLVVYSLLDSHTLFSSMSSLRLDNFVYTVEGFREANGISLRVASWQFIFWPGTTGLRSGFSTSSRSPSDKSQRCSEPVTVCYTWSGRD